MFLTVVTVLLFFDRVYSAVRGTVQSTNDYYCGDSISGSVDYGYANAHVWIFMNYQQADVTFSTCNSPQDFTEGLVLYDYNFDESQAQEIDECYHSTGVGCDACGLTSLTDWTVFNVGEFEPFYIEIYSLTTDIQSYRIDITCVLTPTTAPSNNPTTITNGPTRAPVPSNNPTLLPTISPTTIPTTAPNYSGYIGVAQALTQANANQYCNDTYGSTLASIHSQAD
eukprot:388702_1